MWIKLDDGFATHPKILKAGILALGIQVRAICYASQHKTDGFIPRDAVPLLLTGLERIGLETAQIGAHAAMGCDADEMDWPTFLCEHGLWAVRDGGYDIHDYLEWNVSKADYNKWKKRLSNNGKKGMKSRWNKEKSPITRVITPVITTDITSLSTATATLNPLHSSLSSLSSSESDPHLKSKSHAKTKRIGAREIQETDAPTEKHREFANVLKVDMGPEWGKFKNYCLAHGKRYCNFDAAFRNWLANSLTMNGGKRVV